MEILASTEGQSDLPRYFAAAFQRLQRLGQGRLDFVLADGRRFRVEGAGPGPVAEVRVKSADLFARLVREGELGFCDAYLDGEWESPDLQAFFDLILLPDNLGASDAFPGMALLRAYERFRFWLQSNSRRQARRNIAAHYDLGNDFYRLWLDDSMTYSSALFKTGQESLEKAQAQKYDSLIDQMGVKPGDHVLEIGCGWGGFAEHAAARRDLKVTGLTISQAQYDYATERIRKAGLTDRVEFRLQDYRDERGLYDGIASIEMFEAVGEKYWPVYFRTLFERLKPGRAATLQVITIAENRFQQYRKNIDFIQKYIFPGGMLPAPSVLRKQAEQVGLNVRNSIWFGESYSQTLRRWYESFTAAWPEVKKLGFDDRFRRMWDFYLTSCAGAFKTDNCNVTQITLARPA